MYMETFIAARLAEEAAKPTQMPWFEHVRALLNTVGWIRYNPDVDSPHTRILDGVAMFWAGHPDWSERFPATPSTEKRTVY